MFLQQFFAKVSSFSDFFVTLQYVKQSRLSHTQHIIGVLGRLPSLRSYPLNLIRTMPTQGRDFLFTSLIDIVLMVKRKHLIYF